MQSNDKMKLAVNNIRQELERLSEDIEAGLVDQMDDAFFENIYKAKSALSELMSIVNRIGECD